MDNTTNKKEQSKEKVKKTKKFNNKILDKPTIIFFSIMIILLVFFTVILFITPSKDIYKANFGDNMYSTITIDKNKSTVVLEMNINNEISEDTGTIKDITPKDATKDNKLYKVVFNNNKDEVTFIINDKLTLEYEDGTTIEYLKEE